MGRRLAIGVAVVAIEVAVIAAIIGYQRGLVDGANLASGCGPDVPSDVPYTPGMRVCPGQVIHLTIPIPSQTGDDGGL